MSHTLPDRTMQIGNARAMATEIVHTLHAECYTPEVVAEGLLEGAFFALGNDRDAFLTVLARFRHANGF